VGTARGFARYFLPARRPHGDRVRALSGPHCGRAAPLDPEDPTSRPPGLKDHVDALHRFLRQARQEERDVVLLIDEAQDLSAEVLEQIRLISNLETDTEKLIQIILMGQSELQEMLARRELRQLAQRVTAQYHLAPLSRTETADYVAHRLGSPAAREGLASPGALAAVHQRSGGVPRLINLVCDRALLAGYVSGSRAVNAGWCGRRPARWPGLPRARRVALRRPRGSGGRPGRRRPGPVVGPPAVAPVHGRRCRPRRRPRPSRHPPWLRLEAIPDGAAVSTVPTASAAPSPLAPILLTLDHDRSFQSAVGQIQALWGPDPLERTTLRTHMEQVRRLNLPVVLEMFHPSRRDTCFMALIRLEGDHAVLAAEGAPLNVPLVEVDRLWTRQAVFLWRDFDALTPGGDPQRTNAWVRQTLARLGYPAQDPDLSQTVARFQQDAELAADGVVGTRTLMTLYSRSHYPRPR
jgi:general secretion pathway protein A